MSAPARTLLRTAGGTVTLPAGDLVLVDAADGGHLVVNPPREVWERSELEPAELALWSCLVAATGRAMIDALPQLAGGCVNYWEAGNWSLHDAAPPAGRKNARQHRRVHLHLLGRGPAAASADLRWGESPKFPDYVDRHTWARGHRRLDAAACGAIVRAAVALLEGRYDFRSGRIAPVAACVACGYPTPRAADGPTLCAECRA